MLPKPVRSLLWVLAPLIATPLAAKPDRPPVSFGQPTKALSEVDKRVMPAVDNDVLLADAIRREKATRQGSRFAAPTKIGHAFSTDFGLESAGTWETLADGSRLWRLRLESKGARHLNVGFSRFELPAGAELWIYNRAGDYVQGPYTAKNRSAKGRFFTPMVVGDQAVLELWVPAGAAGPLELRVGSVNHGFRGFEKSHGTCNVDVVCPEGDPWRNQIRSVAAYVVDGVFSCTGQLINNTALDDTPYFLSAAHCEVTEQNADTVVFYWNFESPICDLQANGSLDDNQSGAIFRASEPISDFVLVELAEAPDPDFDVYFTGWDRSGVVPQGSVGIHHPSGDVKSISFNTDPLTPVNIDGGGPLTHWEVDQWELGTTEPGSSGSCLWDPATQLCVGTLTGGFASCTVIDSDYYGRLSVQWEAGDTPSSRLLDWLDPIGTGETMLAGKDPGLGNSTLCRPEADVLCLRGRRFKVEMTHSGIPATVVPGASSESGNFSFFGESNWETLVKVLDGCAIDGHYWVFAAGATDVEWTLDVTDTMTNTLWTYTHLAGQPSPPVLDTQAFATCP